METTIRTAEHADAAALAVLCTQLGYPADAGDVATRLDTWLTDPAGAVIVAEVDGAIAGVAALHAIPYFERTGRWGRLVALVVAEPQRGAGVGRALLSAVEERAMALGCGTIEVTSRRDRAGAHAFYCQLGYRDTCGTSGRFLRSLDR